MTPRELAGQHRLAAAVLLAAVLAWVAGAVVAGDRLLLVSGLLLAGVALGLLWLTRWAGRG